MSVQNQTLNLSVHRNCFHKQVSTISNRKMLVPFWKENLKAKCSTRNHLRDHRCREANLLHACWRNRKPSKKQKLDRNSTLKMLKAVKHLNISNQSRFCSIHLEKWRLTTKESPDRDQTWAHRSMFTTSKMKLKTRKLKFQGPKASPISFHLWGIKSMRLRSSIKVISTIFCSKLMHLNRMLAKATLKVT